MIGNTMTNQYDECAGNRKAARLALGACAMAAALLLVPCFTPAAAAADLQHGRVKTGDAYGCGLLKDYKEVAKAFQQSKKNGKDQLDRFISTGKCRMLPKHAELTVTGTESGFVKKVRVNNEKHEYWMGGRSYEPHQH